MPPPADLDKLDDLKPGSKDTSRNHDSSFDSCLSPPPLTAIYSDSCEDLSNNLNSTASSSFTNTSSGISTFNFYHIKLFISQFVFFLQKYRLMIAVPMNQSFRVVIAAKWSNHHHQVTLDSRRMLSMVLWYTNLIKQYYYLFYVFISTSRYFRLWVRRM